MIEIKIEKSTCDHGATIYTATPAEICLGGLDASRVDDIHVTPPEDWAGCTIRLTVRPNCAPRIARILDDSGILQVTSDMTIKKIRCNRHRRTKRRRLRRLQYGYPVHSV